jgi:hypothetical protein
VSQAFQMKFGFGRFPLCDSRMLHSEPGQVRAGKVIRFTPESNTISNGSEF